MLAPHHQVSRRTEPRPGTRRRALWDRLHAAGGGWVEFDCAEYAPSQETLRSLLAAFRTDYGLDVEAGGSGGALCRWRIRA